MSDIPASSKRCLDSNSPRFTAKKSRVKEEIDSDLDTAESYASEEDIFTHYEEDVSDDDLETIKVEMFSEEEEVLTKETIWSTEGSTMQTFDFKETEKFLVAPPAGELEAFRLLLDDKFLDMTVNATNSNAQEFKKHNKNIRLSRWKKLTRDELLTFLGLLLHMGTIQVHKCSDYWRKHRLFNIPIFTQHMSRDRFMLILQCLNFTGKQKSNGSKMAQTLPVLEYFNKKMQSIYYPGKNLTLDTSVVLNHGHIIFRPTLKNMRFNDRCQKYRMYVLGEPKGIVMKLNLVLGIDFEDNAERNIFKLLENNLYCGHSVYLEDSHISYSLAVRLLDRETYCTGVLSENQKDIPDELKTVALKEGEHKSLFLNGVHVNRVVSVGKWGVKNDNFYMSTEHNSGEESHCDGNDGPAAFEPLVMQRHKKYMAGVEIQDQMLLNYPCEKYMMPLFKKVFIHVLQILVSNSFHFYSRFRENNTNDLYSFRLTILEKLLPETPRVHPILKILIPERSNVPHAFTKIENCKLRVRENKDGTKRTTREIIRKTCKGCSEGNKRTYTLYECKQCDGAPGYCPKCYSEVHFSFSSRPDCNVCPPCGGTGEQVSTGTSSGHSDAD